MDHFKNIKYKKSFVKDIKESKYTQGLYSPKNNIKNKPIIKPEVKYKFLLDCILYTNDPDSILNKHGKGYVDNKRMEIAVDMDEKSDECFDNYNYKKSFKKKLVQKNMINLNYLSSILYLCDYFKISLIIYDKHKNKCISLCSKYDKTNIYMFDNGWIKYNDKVDIDIDKMNPENINDYFLDDLNKNYNIYEGGLNNISKYKLKDLQEIADKNNISLKQGTKNKLKKQLYDELNNLKTII